MGAGPCEEQPVQLVSVISLVEPSAWIATAWIGLEAAEGDMDVMGVMSDAGDVEVAGIVEVGDVVGAMGDMGVVGIDGNWAGAWAVAAGAVTAASNRAMAVRRSPFHRHPRAFRALISYPPKTPN